MGVSVHPKSVGLCQRFVLVIQVLPHKTGKTVFCMDVYFSTWALAGKGILHNSVVS